MSRKKNLDTHYLLYYILCKFSIVNASAQLLKSEETVNERQTSMRSPKDSYYAAYTGLHYTSHYGIIFSKGKVYLIPKNLHETIKENYLFSNIGTVAGRK